MNVISEQRQELLPHAHGRFDNCHASTLIALPSGDHVPAKPELVPGGHGFEAGRW